MLWIALASILVASLALLLNGYLAILAWKHRNTEHIFSLFEKYEKYSMEYLNSLSSGKEEQDRCLRNAMGYFENISLIHNRKYVSRPVRRYLAHIIKTFVSLVEANGVEFIEVINALRFHDEDYKELATFVSDRRKW